MNRSFALLVMVVLAWAGLVGMAWATESQFAPGEMDFSRVNPALQVSTPTANVTSLTLSAPNVLMTDTVVGYQTYQVFGIPGEPFDLEEGHPAVPQITRLYRIPNTGSVELVVNEAACHMVEGVDPFPIQWEKETFDSKLTRKQEIYENNDWYPPVVAEMSAPMIFRDFRVVSVTLYPVQVNPVTGQARVYDQLSVDVAANDTPGQNELLNPRPPSGAFAPIYRDMIRNLDDDALDGATPTPGSYLILCRDNATSLQWADSLRTWKKRRGYYVVVDARNNWTSTLMRQAIRNGYNDWDPPLEYACILGDVTGNFSMPTGGGQYDHYFALMQDGDDLEDIGVGRLSCESASQFGIVMAKIFGYERNPYVTDPSWCSRAFLYAGTASNVRSNLLCMRWARNQFVQYTGVTDVDVVGVGGAVSCQVIGNHLTEGIAFFMWRGTVVYEMFCGDESCGQASFKLPVALTITCGSGDFDLSSEPAITECWLRAGTSPSAPKGGVCGIGTATWNTHVPYNNTVAGGLAYGIANLGIENLGLALAAAKMQLHAAFPGSQHAVNFSNWNNLMGEPSLSMWTQPPVIMNVTFPATVNIGARRVQPQVTNNITGDPIQDALVVLWKGDEVYSRALTDAGGFADVPVTVNTGGNMYLTVTKRNHKPFLGDINCVPAARMVALTSYTVDDDNVGGTQGNSNGQLNPGELIDLPLYLKNFGTSSNATAISAQMSSSNSHVTIVSGTQTYPNLSPGDSALGASPFRIQVSPQMIENETALLTLAVTASGELTHSAFEVRCQAGDANYVSHQVTGGDGDSRLEPNETANMRVTIRNDGSLNMTGVVATLISNSSFIAVTQGTATYGNITIGQSVTNTSQPFTLRANTLVYPGHQAAMMLVLNMPNGSADTALFSIPIGFIASTDPTGPDDYGYYAYDDTDDSVEFHREFSYEDIHISGTNLNLADPGEQMPNDPSRSTARQLPFDFVYYGQTYDSITICANGWAAFGVQADLDLFRNYPIPGEQAPNAMLAPFWDDLKTNGSGKGVWVYNDNANHRYVIQWRATGWYGSDGNVNLDFEIILLDPAFYPTRSGDGIIIFQYQDIAEMPGEGGDISYSTVGIEAPDCRSGLEYRFNNFAEPGAASLVDSRVITFTTESRAAFGQITGSVVNAETNQPMGNVLVSVDGHNDQATTAADGHYTIEDVLIGTYTIRAREFGFNDGLTENVVIEQDSTRTVNFSMLHPEVTLSTDTVEVFLPQQPQETSLRMTNDGNGPLDYQITIRYVAQGPQGPLDDTWDYLTGINVSQLTTDYQIQGCEFVGDYWWVSGGAGADGQKYFYRFNLDGTFHDQIPQPSGPGCCGWWDLAYDGNLIYGSDGAELYGVNQAGVVQDTVPAPLNPNRAIAYDPQTDHFWVADFATDIWEITRTGALIRRFDNTLKITGLAWNPSDQDGYKLYIFHRDDGMELTRVSRMHPVSGDQQFVVQLQGRPGDRSGGCAITPAWNSTMLVFAGIQQNSDATGDRLGIWELAFNTTWITITPMIASVPGNSWRDVSVVFDPTTLRDATYQVNMTIHNNSVDSSLVVPVVLHVALAADDPPEAVIPETYELYQNYPNPFNSSTTFQYDVKHAGMTTLRVYNLLGQEVATVVDQFMDAGRHAVNLDMNGLASGVYLYRLESGEFTAVRKLMLMK